MAPWNCVGRERGMAEEPNNIVLEHLRKIDRKVERVAEDVVEIKTAVIALDGHMASFHVQVAGHSSELDKIKTRLDRIERRLELSDT
jgi:tetrahydromethanopterin S-methyltransferase subunit G